MRSRWHDSTTPPMIVQMLNSCAPSSSSASARHLTMMRSLSSGIPPPRVACHRLGCGRFSRRRASGSFGSVRGQSRRRSAARFSRSIGGALQGTHLGDVQAERLVGRGDEGRPLAGLNLETPESHLLLASSLSSVGEAVFDDVRKAVGNKPENSANRRQLFFGTFSLAVYRTAGLCSSCEFFASFFSRSLASYGRRYSTIAKLV